MSEVGQDRLRRKAMSTNGVALGFLRRAAAQSPGLISRAAPILELALAAAIGFVALLTVLSVFAPLPTPERFPDPQSKGAETVLPRGAIANPFRQSSAANDSVEPENRPEFAETALNLTLHGTWIDENGGSAVIKTPDGEQGVFAIGDEIWNGARLDQVYRDQIVINSAGVRESLRLVNRDAGVLENAPIARTPANATAVTLGDAIRITPRPHKGGMALSLQPGPDRRRFASLGLQPGDILIAVDNRRIGPEIASEVEQLRNLATRPAISIIIDRDGVAIPIEIDLTDNEETDLDDD